MGVDFAESTERRSAYKGTAEADSLGKSGSVKSEFKTYQVVYSSGRGSVRVRKGRAACPEFWAKVDAAEALGAAYCGFHHGQCDPDEMATSYQCAACYRARMVGYTNYRPPSLRQSYRDICPREERVAEGSYRDDPGAHRRAWDQYRAENSERETRRAEAERIRAELSTMTSPPRERKSTSVETGLEPDYGLYSPEVAARMAALRKELGIE